MKSVALLIPVLLAAGCSNSFRADDLDLAFDTLQASFVENKDYSYDLDEDGVTDITVEGVGVTLTDRDDLCARGGAVDDQDDILAVQIIVFAEGDISYVDTNATLREMMPEPFVGAGFVGVRVMERRGGELISNYVSRNLLDADDQGDSEFSVNEESSSSGEISRLSATFSAVLEADVSPDATADTDIDADGTSDFAAVHFDVSGAAVGASACSDLEILL